jgi:hypothetical protein
MSVFDSPEWRLLAKHYPLKVDEIERLRQLINNSNSWNLQVDNSPLENSNNKNS